MKKMKKVKISVIRIANYTDLIEKYEKPMELPCEMTLGQIYVSENGKRPQNFCESAWQTLEPFVKTLAQGGGSFYGDWMKNPHSAMLSCNDGFRPVSFLVETLESE